MNKKILAIMMLFIMILSMAACSSKKDSNTTTSEADSTATPSPTQAAEADPTLYNANTIAEKIGLDLSKYPAKTADFGTVKTSKVKGANDYSDCTFYVFASEADAMTAFEYVKTKLVTEESKEETSNTVIGQSPDAYGILDINFYYVTKNIIITRNDYISDPGVANAVQSEKSKNDSVKRHEEIMSTWP